MLPHMRDGSKCHQLLKSNKYSLYGYTIPFKRACVKALTRTHNVCESLSVRVGYKRGVVKFFAIRINIAENSSSHNFSKCTAYIAHIDQVEKDKYKTVGRDGPVEDSG